jgi:hypothetical protein
VRVVRGVGNRGQLLFKLPQGIDPLAGPLEAGTAVAERGDYVRAEELWCAAAAEGDGAAAYQLAQTCPFRPFASAIAGSPGETGTSDFSSSAWSQRRVEGQRQDLSGAVNSRFDGLGGDAQDFSGRVLRQPFKGR